MVGFGVETALARIEIDLTRNRFDASVLTNTL